MKKDLVRGNDSLSYFDYLFEEFMGMSRPLRKNLNIGMRADVQDLEDKYIIEVEIPGIKKEDINIYYDNGYLIVEGRSGIDKMETSFETNYVRKERICGSCARSFYVGEVKEDKINAKVEDGILSIVVPKEDEKIDTKKRIEIK